MGSYIWFIRVLMLYNIFPFLFRNQVTIKELKESRTKGGNKDIKVLFELHPKRDQIDQTEPMVLLCSCCCGKNPTPSSMWFPEYMISISYVWLRL